MNEEILALAAQIKETAEALQSAVDAIQIQINELTDKVKDLERKEYESKL